MQRLKKYKVLIVLIIGVFLFTFIPTPSISYATEILRISELPAGSIVYDPVDRRQYRAFGEHFGEGKILLLANFAAGVMEYGAINTFLQEDFKSSLSQNFQDAIRTVEVYTSDILTEETIFLLSQVELGGQGYPFVIGNHGKAISGLGSGYRYISGGYTGYCPHGRDNYNWTRSHSTYNGLYIWAGRFQAVVSAYGWNQFVISWNNQQSTVRPALNLSSDLMVQYVGDGKHEIVWNKDDIPPTTDIYLNGLLGNNNWYTSNVEITLTAADEENGSGIAKTEYSFDDAIWNEYSSPFTVDIEGTTTVYFRSIDNAENVEATKTQSFKIDKTAPEIAIDSPMNEVVYLLNEEATASWSVEDEISGIESSSGTVPSGSTIDTSILGANSFSVYAVDEAGNESTKTVTYSVLYDYSGVLSPLNNVKKNAFKLNRNIPVKFQLKDYYGNFITDATGKLYIAKIENGITGEELEGVTAGKANEGNLFRYDSKSDQYVFNLDTKTLSTGIWQLKISLDDGTSKYTNIEIVK